MGFDILDTIFRAEKTFRVKIPRDGLARLMLVRDPPDITAGELHDYLCELCRASGQPAPWSSWGRVKIVLVHSLGASPLAIHRNSLLKRDLGM